MTVDLVEARLRVNSMIKKCPDCLTASKLHSDYPSTFFESLFQSIGLIKVKRCSNCNAAVFVVIGILTTSRKKMKTVRNFSFWITFVLLLVVTGYFVFEAVVS